MSASIAIIIYSVKRTAGGIVFPLPVLFLILPGLEHVKLIDRQEKGTGQRIKFLVKKFLDPEKKQ